MNPDQAKQVVIEVIGQIAPEVDLADADPDADLRSEIDLDSLDFLSMVEGLKERTGVEVPEPDYPMVRSLSGVIAYLCSKDGNESPAAR